MKPEAAKLLAKAKRHLANARHDHAGEFFEGACRYAYMGMFSAALAYVFQRDGQSPRTHSGLRATFNKLAKDDAGLPNDLPPLLGQGYRFKELADYSFDAPIGAAEAVALIEKAERFLRAIDERLARPR